MKSHSSLQQFDLICFDFDGLLVNTEPLHYKTYLLALEKFGVPLDVDYWTYSHICHGPNGSKLHQVVLEHYPSFDEDWEKVRDLKRSIYSELLQTEEMALMDGVDELLPHLIESGIQTCVVTNSFSNDTDALREKLPILNNIPLWMTRERYSRGKPFSDGYLKALEHFPSIRLARVAGLDDTMRGVTAITGAGIYPILVCNRLHPQLKDAPDIEFFESLETIDLPLPL